MNHRFKKNLIGMLLLLTPLLVLAGGTDTRQYPLLSHGKLLLQVPAGWQQQVKQPPNQLPPTINFTPKMGDAFTVVLTPIWALKKDKALPTWQQIKQRIKNLILRIKPKAVEKSIPVKELKGKEGMGYYYFATNKAHKPREFKYITQGMIEIGDLLTTFTILSNEGGENDVTKALNMIKNAEQVK